MPQWIHNRTEHLLAKNPSMSKSTAFAIATQQSHSLGKTPKGYGTAKGKKKAKAKYDAPKKGYVKSPNPGDLETPKLPDKPKTRWTGSKLVPKEAAVLPTWLDKPLRGERMDPSSEDFAKNRAFGNALLTGGYPGAILGAIGGTALGARAKGIPGALVGGPVGYLAGAGLGTAVKFPSKLKEQKEKQRKKEEKRKKASVELRFVSKALDILCKKAGIRTPESQLAKTQNIGVPKPDPKSFGIGQVAKPKGYGNILPGLKSSSS